MDNTNQQSNSIAVEEKILAQVLKEYDAALKYRSPRITDSWHPNEDLYYGRKQKKLKGRHNVQFGDMQGFVDTLLSKIDDPPMIRFSPTEEADLRKAKKVTKAWEKESSVTEGDWGYKDLLGKKMAILYGRVAYKFFAVSDPVYLSNLVLMDTYDLIVDPMTGGLDLENARFLQHDNIFKSIYELEKDGLYNQKQVAKLKIALAKDDTHDVDNEQKEKANRLSILGMDTRMYRYQGDGVVKLREAYTTYEGYRYLCTYESSQKVWLRVEKLKEIFETPEYPNGDPLWPIDSWAPNPDAFEFWSPSPADQVRDGYIAESILINQALDNRMYRNFGMKAYDTTMFKNPALLEPRWAGLVPVTPAEGRGIQQGIYEFQYPSLDDTSIIHNLIDQKLSKNSGITPGTQGLSENDKKVGVFEGEIAQVADRMGLTNKSYARFWVRMGKRYINGLKEHLKEPMAVRMIGEVGIEWDQLIGEDLKAKYDIQIFGSNAELNADARKKKSKYDALMAEKESQLINQKLALEKKLEIAGFETAEIKELMDTKHEGDQEIIAEAAEENQKMLTKDVESNEGATTAHIQKHLDFIKDNELKPEIQDRIMKHAKEEIVFARKNMVDLLAQEMSQKGQMDDIGQPTEQSPSDSGQEQPASEETPIPGFPFPTTPSLRQPLTPNTLPTP